MVETAFGVTILIGEVSGGGAHEVVAGGSTVLVEAVAEREIAVAVNDRAGRVCTDANGAEPVGVIEVSGAGSVSADVPASGVEFAAIPDARVGTHHANHTAIFIE